MIQLRINDYGENVNITKYSKNLFKYKFNNNTFYISKCLVKYDFRISCITIYEDSVKFFGFYTNNGNEFYSDFVYRNPRNKSNEIYTITEIMDLFTNLISEKSIEKIIQLSKNTELEQINKCLPYELVELINEYI